MLKQKACLACAERRLRDETKIKNSKKVAKDLEKYKALWELGYCMCVALWESGKNSELARISTTDNPPDECPYILEHTVL